MGRVPGSIGKHLDNTPSAQYETPVKIENIKIEMTDEQIIREENKEDMYRLKSENQDLKFQSYVEDDELSRVVTSGR